jgi:hypothetical protein
VVDASRWRLAEDAHRAAVAAFIDAAKQVPDGRWNEPLADGKWSPAQIAEHLRLSYATLRSELEGEGGFRVRVGPAKRLLLRFTVLRRMLRRRVFPQGAPATREIRPGGGPFEREATLAGLAGEAGSFGERLAARRDERGTHVTHPFFGALDPLQGLELCALHVHHHRAQLPVAPAAGEPAAAKA